MATLDVLLYYFFHFAYLGHPQVILSHLWVARDMMKEGNREGEVAWRNFYETMKESYRTTSILAGLVAASSAALLSVDAYTGTQTARTLLLATLISSMLSAMQSMSFLSTVVVNPVAFQQRWETTGMVLVIQLSGPPAWLSISFWCMRAALLGIVWQSDGLAARIVTTTLLGGSLTTSVTLDLMARAKNPTSRHSPIVGFILNIFGFGEDITPRFATLDSTSTHLRDQANRRLEAVSRSPITQSASSIDVSDIAIHPTTLSADDGVEVAPRQHVKTLDQGQSLITGHSISAPSTPSRRLLMSSMRQIEGGFGYRTDRG